MHKLMPASLKTYGHLKFLTYQCLLIQLLNSFLHVGAHFISFLRGPRDLVFSALAYPVGSLVVYTFWAVWHLMGRELIFPVAASEFYPDWLNHATHTLIAPLNLLLLYSMRHKFSNFSLTLCLAYFASYTAFLHYIKFHAGVFVYKYLDAMNDTERLIYFAGTGVFAFIMFKTGQYLNSLIHDTASQRPALKKSKQK